MIVGSLGKTIFGCSEYYIKTINNLTLNKKVRYSEHKIIGGRTKIVMDGQDLDDLSFEIHLNANFNVNPLAAAKELEDYMKQGKRLKFILGGKVVGNGDYVITGMNETYKAYSALGTCTKMVVKLNLKEYN